MFKIEDVQLVLIIDGAIVLLALLLRVILWTGTPDQSPGDVVDV
jgi:hypothetical protein